MVLMVVVEQKPGKFCIVINHSFLKPLSGTSHKKPPPPSSETIIVPELTSINPLIDSDCYPCKWGTFSECYLLVADAPLGTEAAVFNVDAAFSLMIDSLVHLDQALNFGVASSPSIWGQVADVMADIYLQHGVQALIKWVDNFMFFWFPSHSVNGTYEYPYNADLIWGIADQLGWPWAPDKFKPFTGSF
uniref:Uncharacterized protein n=1 Tax=Moniliophthora roreri TaxID=221103 RepID=A0A0W0FSW3_MONRR